MGVPPRPPIPRTPPVPVPEFYKPTLIRMPMFLLLWADSGAGKTTLAATAPGDKAYIQFDPGGYVSLANRTDYFLLDCSGYSYANTMAQFNTVDPFNIKKFISETPSIGTIVIDSVTTLAHQALQYAVTIQRNSTFDMPGQHGYGTRNQVMRRVVGLLMQIASALDKNLIVIAHEGVPDEDSKQITLSLSTALSNDISLRFNEVWWMKDMGDARQIHIRSHGRYKPMKSRMFLSNGANFFTWHYDADTKQGDGIAEWMAAWQANGGDKIPLPERRIQK